MRKFSFLITLLFIATSVWAQNTINVSPGQSIQAAIYAAQDGDIILVAPGHYEEAIVVTIAGGTMRTGLLFGEEAGIAKNLTVRSTHGAAQTVVDVTGSANAVAIYKNSGLVTIDGFTFVGFDSRGIANGMASWEGTTCHIMNNRVINASGALLQNGNGIQVSGFNSIIKNNFVEGAILNSDSWGGSGIYIAGGKNCLIENNIVQGSDYGLSVSGYYTLSPVSADNNIVRNNISRYNLTGAATCQFMSNNNIFKNNQLINSYRGYVDGHDTRELPIWIDGVKQADPTGLKVGRGVPTNTVLEGNNFINNDYNGNVFLSFNDNPTVIGPDIPAEHVVRTLCNWWGDYTGPYNEDLNPEGAAPALLTNHWTLEGWSTEEWTENTGNCNQPLFWETENTGYSVRLNWDKDACLFPNAESYVVHIREKGTQAWLQGKSVEPTRKIFSLQPGVRYQVRVLFYSGANWNIYLGFKGIFEFSTKTTTLEKIQDIGTAFLLDWDEVQSADSYIAHIKKGNDPWQHTALTTNSHTRVFSRIPGEEYAVRVLAFKGGQYIGISPEVNVTANIVNFNVTKAGTEATISWTNIGAVRYILHYREVGSLMWIQANANVPSRKLINLTPGKTYQYRLLAYFMVDGAEEYGGATGIQTFIAGDGGKSTVVTETIPVVNVYPNPFVDVLNIEMEADADKDITYTIVDVTGKVVKTGTNNVVAGYNTITVNVAELPAGIYVINADNQSFTITK